jgi:hypothetical protein
MVERITHFGEECAVYRNVRVGEIAIHAGDTVFQQYGPSTSFQLLVRSVDANGSLLLYKGSHAEVPVIDPGALLNAVYCPHVS